MYWPFPSSKSQNFDILSGTSDIGIGSIVESRKTKRKNVVPVMVSKVTLRSYTNCKCNEEKAEVVNLKEATQ